MKRSDNMKPIPSEVSYEMLKMLERAKSLEEKIAKAEPGFKPEPSKDSSPHFVSETGGQTRNAYYTTNGATLETEDAPKPKNKKEKKDVSMEKLGQKMNPHEGGGVEREDAVGEAKPLDLTKANPLAERREAAEMGHAPQICGRCGGTTREGCRMHQGMELNACPEYRPLE
jgi:hypothetical protein